MCYNSVNILLGVLSGAQLSWEKPMEPDEVKTSVGNAKVSYKSSKSLCDRSFRLFKVPQVGTFFILPKNRIIKPFVGPSGVFSQKKFKNLSIFFTWILLFFCYTNYCIFAPVAQWIERRPPEPGAWVQFPSGVPIKKTAADFLRLFFYIL